MRKSAAVQYHAPADECLYTDQGRRDCDDQSSGANDRTAYAYAGRAHCDANGAGCRSCCGSSPNAKDKLCHAATAQGLVSLPNSSTTSMNEAVDSVRIDHLETRLKDLEYKLEKAAKVLESAFPDLWFAYEQSLRDTSKT